MVLTRHGLHHLHVGIIAPGNPKGRSGGLVFPEVQEKEFRIVAISDHDVFDARIDAATPLLANLSLYMANDVPPSQAFMANPVMASGHSMLVTLFAGKCEDGMCGLILCWTILHLLTSFIMISRS
jgi:hypothetical protein